MSAGELNRRVRFEKRAATSDKYGNAVDDWQMIFDNEPASIRPVRGAEDVIAAKLQGRQIVEIKVRYSNLTTQVNTDHRAVNAATGEAFNIRVIENKDMRGRYLTMLCESGVASG